MIEFTQTNLPDSTIRFSWKASYFEDFHGTVELLKSAIPAHARRFDPGEKAWFIAHEYSVQLQDIQTRIQTENLARPIEEEQELKVAAEARFAFDKIGQLKQPFLGRAIFAAKVALGHVNAPLAYCLCRQEYGAWCAEDGVWYYTDGRYSSYSPDELDEKARRAAASVLGSKISEIASVRAIPLDEAKAALRSELIEKHNHTCLTCGRRPKSDSKLHMHRVVPGKDGGLYTESNIALLCSSCHRKYEGKPWEAILSARGKRGAH